MTPHGRSAPFRVPALANGQPQSGLRAMRMLATFMLVAMAILFIAATRLQPLHPTWGFVRAFAEAAMVGGLADWFAVTALFRHPLGLPIPHTAIIPRNKNRIGDTLAQFLRDNFLIPRVVARRMQRLDIAQAAGRWLADPKGGEGRIRRGASRLAADLLTAFDPQRLGGMVKSAIGQRLRATDVSPLVGQALSAGLNEGRHKDVLDSAIRWASRTLTANEHLIHAIVHERAGSVLRWTGLDETLAGKIVDGLEKLLHDMATDAEHPLRLRAEEGLANLAWDLQHDEDMRARVEALKIELIDNPAMQHWLDGLWESARAAMLRVARNPDAVLQGRLGEMLRQLGETLQRDAALAQTINRFVRRAAVGAASDYGDGIVRLVSETVHGWDARTITTRLENAVGRDLQYIRINGTLVGGLVGLAIHAVSLAL